MKKINSFSISPSDINLIEASAGTGKTYNIASLFVRLIIVEGLPVGRILVVTYTEAATKELKERLMNRLRESVNALKTGRPVNKKGGEDAFLKELLEEVKNPDKGISLLNEAIRNFDEAAVYTIHGFCYQALQEHAFESRLLYDAEMVGDDSNAVQELVDDYWRHFVSGASESRLKQPLLKYLADKGYNPETLASELGEYTGKTYLEILPEIVESCNKEALNKLGELFDEMKNIWDHERREIANQLDNDGLSGNKYRTEWVEAWMLEMQDWLSSNTAPLELFEKFEKFTQSAINGSLKKNSNTVPPQHRFFGLCEVYSELAQPFQGFDIQFKKDLLVHIREEIDKKKELMGILSYDDLLLKLQTALREPEHGDRLAAILRKTYPVALVDEFQDTDPVQYHIFRTIYGKKDTGSGLFMIGDPKQSIYSFRGADIFTYLEARKDVDEDRVYHLSENYRSTPGLLKAINGLFSESKHPFVFEHIHFNPVKPGKQTYSQFKENNFTRPELQIQHLTVDKNERSVTKKTATKKAVAATVSEIHRLLEQGKKGKIAIDNDLKAKDLAILVRSHKQAGLMADALREKGIKSVQYSQENVYTGKEAEDLQRVLQAVAEPSNEMKVRTALSTDLLAYNALEIYELEEDEKKWADIFERFLDLHRQWQERGFAYMFRSLLKEQQIPLKLIRLPYGERVLTNILHLGELLQARDLEKKGGMRGLIKWLNGKRKETGVPPDEEQLRLESDEGLVKIVTMHRSKGLEYPVVFCPFLWYGPELKDGNEPVVFHDPDRSNHAFIDLNGKDGDRRATYRWLAEREELAESLRLAYVALTRAKQRCYVSWIAASKAEFSPLGYLLLDPDIVLEGLKSSTRPGNNHKPPQQEHYNEKLNHLAEAYGDCIEILPVDEERTRPVVQSNDEAEPVLFCRTFNREKPLATRRQISSFSSLIRHEGEDAELPDYDQFFEKVEEPGPTDAEKSIFTFPRGPKPGICIHKIFEALDFSDLSGLPEIVKQNLEKYGIDLSWAGIIMPAIERVVSKPLLAQPQLNLAGLKPADILPEMEFYYTIDRIDSSELAAIIRGKNGPEEISSRPIEAGPGFMKGYIDLVFRSGGKYYIADYKTNHLGNSSEDYGREQLQQEIWESGYDLQYHIYTAALHRYLEKRLPGYSFENNFGGVFYLFLRGINGQPVNRNGIYFDRPGEATITGLNIYFEEGGR